MTDIYQMLMEERGRLVLEKADLSAELAKMGMSGNRRYYVNGSISKELWDKRSLLAGRVAEIEVRLHAIKKETVQARIDSDIKFGILMDIIKQSLGEKYLLELMREVRRREEGQPEFKVPYGVKEKSGRSYLEEYKKAIALLISARRSINAYIEKNEPEINKADYLKSVSEINKSIPPVRELEKLIP